MLTGNPHYKKLAVFAALSILFVTSGCLGENHLYQDGEETSRLTSSDFQNPTMDVQINDIPLTAIDELGVGSVAVEQVRGGTRWHVELDGNYFVVTEGNLAIKDNIDEFVLALNADPRISAEQRENTVEELEMLASRLGAASSSSPSLTDWCSYNAGSLNFSPSFQRNMWYGWVWSTLSWSAWAGPPAPWQNTIWARAIADGNTYYNDSNWQSSGPFITTNYMSVTASAAVGPESTYGIVLYAYAYFESTACPMLWFQQVNQL